MNRLHFCNRNFFVIYMWTHLEQIVINLHEALYSDVSEDIFYSVQNSITRKCLVSNKNTYFNLTNPIYSILILVRIDKIKIISPLSP